MNSPYLTSYVSGNIHYNFEDYTSQSDLARYTFSGNKDYNKQYRYRKFQGRDRYNNLLSQASIVMMSKEITKRLTGVHPEGKNIMVPDETIISVADTIYDNTNHATLEVIQQMIIGMIVNHIQSEYDTIQNNNKLDIWVTNYDGDYGIQRINGIKLNRKQRKTNYGWTY